jgi:hypothetical protein
MTLIELTSARIVTAVTREGQNDVVTAYDAGRVPCRACRGQSAQHTVATTCEVTLPIGVPPLGAQLGEPWRVAVTLTLPTPGWSVHPPASWISASGILQVVSLKRLVTTPHVVAGAPHAQGAHPR